MREWRTVSGVAEETKDSAFMPRYCVYHPIDLGIDATVRTRWSSDLIVAAGVEEAILKRRSKRKLKKKL